MKHMNRVWTMIAAGAFLALGTGCPQTPPGVDEPASDLDATISVQDVEANPTDNAVSVLVTFAKGGSAVTLSNAALTCNGVNLVLTSAGYEARVPLVAPGGSYTFQHVRNGATTPVAVMVPERPRVISPMMGGTVQRNVDFAATYQVAGGSSVTASIKTRLIEVSGGAQPDNGTATIPASQLSSLSAGEGVLHVVRVFDTSPADTGFHSVRLLYSTGAPSINVTVL